MKSSAKKKIDFDESSKLLVLPGNLTTVESIVKITDRQRKRLDISLYRIRMATGRAPDTVSRFFTEQDPGTERWGEDRALMGRVNLQTALEILHSVGLDVEVVKRANGVADQVGSIAKKRSKKAKKR